VRSRGDKPVSRLTIDITDQQHQSLKALAALQGKTIKQYALERLFPGDADADQAWQELKKLLGNRINNGLEGKISTKSIGDILDDELSGERA
jgi:Antitoxin ParD.